jgi:hypothetical protein
MPICAWCWAHVPRPERWLPSDPIVQQQIKKRDGYYEPRVLCLGCAAEWDTIMASPAVRDPMKPRRDK